MYQSRLPLSFPELPVPREKKGVVYTKPWVVEFLLDLARYNAEANLVDAVAIEPAAGEGAFLVSMVRRLVESCHRQGRVVAECAHSLLAYELDDESARKARSNVVKTLTAMGVSAAVAEVLARGWIRVGDFLFEAFSLPQADFVIGNPPYIRLEEIPDETSNLYRDAYPTMKGRADLYVAFFEASLRRLKENGVCAFICADRWMRNQYGAELRRLVTRSFAIDAVVEMHNAEAFDDDVSAYPAITVIRRGEQQRAVVASIDRAIESTKAGELASAMIASKDGENTQVLEGVSRAVVSGWFRDSDPWPCRSPRKLAQLRRLEDRFEPLETDASETRVGIGVATGLDEVFITRDPHLVEESRLLPLAMAADTITGTLQWSGHYLVNPWNEHGLVNLEEFPRLRAYLERHQEALKKRHTARKNALGWYRTIDRVHQALTATPKLYIPDIKDRLNPVLDKGQTYPHHNLYFIQSETWDLEVLGGLLLSALGQFFVESYGVRMRGGYLRFQAQYLRRIRVPSPDRVSRSQATQLVRAFRNRDAALATRVACAIYEVDPSEVDVES